MNDTAKNKAQLRAWALRRRAEQSGTSCRLEPEALGNRLDPWLGGAVVRVVGGYLSLAHECSPEDVMQSCHAAGLQVAVPAWNPLSRRYGFCRWHPDMPLRNGPLRVREPVRKVWISPCHLDLVLVPGLVFDRAGGRIGFGAGHYDRFLARCRPGARFLGIAFDWQVIDRVPQDAGDIRMHAVATPLRLHRAGPS